ncbi:MULTISPECIES: pur operon repressor [Clostridium]|jgi:purine operon repressor|uniref:Pur operon repressor PurR n=1 Tax=Clostridium saccharoperbutylacetonicum N1-4(HMT) TaxID=931276 RepID=M1MQN0_9CLOT|nr:MULTISPECIES: pur operon repressor [Clostridium]AGF53937.1 Pur operon repressor PurR [Clostridium saccharoperbutylacetonicum N1-4(HMT)]AQR92841.1 Pur operon repressor [Clostridium saccharoperbutylacetonicum]NRT59550.1 purine operon repressor [Clostridium saccharoperbutylacetonicum]NSB28742.1 purine operon repressor [Clostridium saccharoperbutylacetonicum]NSB34252.1 purine operon repressor [Clostridium saccharoperbutylacetonicum]
MEKFTRNKRVVVITKILLENPNKILGLNKFSELLNAAKSTISEDIVVVREVLERLEMGKVETIAGVAGGIKYIPQSGEDENKTFALELCKQLSDDGRVIPGNIIYMTDLMYNPSIISKAGVMLSSCFQGKDVNYVITVETKGIPLAYEVARNLGVQLVIARRDSQVTEGPTVTINYVSGSNGRLQQMSLSKKSMKPASKCIFIDDFMKGGGTAIGIKDLLKEFDSELVGIGVLVDNKQIDKILDDEYVSVVELKAVDKSTIIGIQPSKTFS